jgi:hypothetical protein
MFLEMINDLFMSSSIFYFYFGMFIMTIGISKLFTLQQGHWRTRTNISFNDNESMRANVSFFERILVSHELFIIWFVKSFKRIDKPDDDLEDLSISYLYTEIKIRGGQLWKKVICSQAFGRTEFLF